MPAYLLILFVFMAHPAAAQTVVMEDAACRYLKEYQQQDGVEYVPGRDAKGNPVVPADLYQSPVQLPEIVEFDITVDLAEYAGLTVPEGTEGLAKIGTIRIENNQLKFNGEPLKPESEQALIALCEEDISNAAE